MGGAPTPIVDWTKGAGGPCGRILSVGYGHLRRIMGGVHRDGAVTGAALEPHLRSEAGGRILGALAETPGLAAPELAARLGLDGRLVDRHLEALRGDGIVAFEREGGDVRFYISQRAKEPLARIMPRNYQCPGLKKE